MSKARTGRAQPPPGPPATRPASFGEYYLGTVFRPRRTFDALVNDPRRVLLGFQGLSVAIACYLAVYFFLSRNGGRPTVFKPWLAIDPEVYYQWNLYLTTPGFLLGWVAAAGFAQIAARAAGGSGAFEALLSTFGFGIGVATWATGLHDVVTTFLGYIGFLNQREYEDALSSSTAPGYLLRVLMTVYLVWFLELFAKAAGAAHGLGTAAAAAVGTLGFAVYQVVFVIFNR